MIKSANISDCKDNNSSKPDQQKEQMRRKIKISYFGAMSAEPTDILHNAKLNGSLDMLKELERGKKAKITAISTTPVFAKVEDYD